MSETSDREQLIRAGRKRPLYVPGATTRQLSLGREEIGRLLPHRPPFLLVDAIRAVDTEERAIVGSRRIDPADPILRGHFPGDPVYPGVLLVESVAQLCVCLVAFLKGSEAGPPPRLRLIRLHHASFIAEARPGDELTLIGKLVEDNGYTAVAAGQVLKGAEVCAMAIMEVYLLDEE
jgi:3-hydroxymyristoyl/3-hydroxydecanoyl-(acyl carrier protein) dehydratase